MAMALPSTDNTYLHTLEQAKQDLWNRNAHLSQQQRQELWLSAASVPSSAFDINASQVPRSMAYSASCSAQSPTLDLSSMDRTQSAPVPFGRSIPTTHNANLPQRSNTVMPVWQSSYEDTANDYTLYPDTPPIRKQSTLQSINETSTFTKNAMVEYTPEEFINNCIEPSSSPSLPLAHNPDSHQLHVQLTPSMQWSQSMDGSNSPSTPSSVALMTPVTQSSNDMSRQSSFSPHFLDVSMLRVHSDSSSIYPPLLSEDGAFSYHVESKGISACADTSHLLNFTGSPSETFFSPAHVFSSANALETSENSKAYLVEDMRRSPSSSSESNSSNASACSTDSRQSRREREINATAASRKIAPKAIESNGETRSASFNDKMVRIRSEDGSSKDVGVITKTPYIRPQHPKVMCQYCNERPNGFRGTHELDRHIARAHATVRKGFVCVDASADKKFLANCKHCRNKKAYGAYYNAAAHLRRAHFHPRKRGPKGKRDEKRGGIGGGDDPAMDHLKQFWIKEVEVVETKQRSPSSPDSISEDLDGSNHDTTFEPTHITYPSQPAHEVPSSIEPNQFVDLSMFMNPSEPLFDLSTHFVTYNDPNSSAADPNNFQFDAYLPQ